MPNIVIKECSGSVYEELLPKPSVSTASQISYSNSSTRISSNNVQGAIDNLFTSVSNRKQMLAGAITDKGILTSKDDTFQTMANNIKLIKTYEISTNQWQKNPNLDLILPFSNIPIDRILIASTSYSSSYYGVIWLDTSTQKWKARVGRSEYEIGNYTLDGIVQGSSNYSGSGYIFNSVFVYK